MPNLDLHKLPRLVKKIDFKGKGYPGYVVQSRTGGAKIHFSTAKKCFFVHHSLVGNRSGNAFNDELQYKFYKKHLEKFLKGGMFGGGPVDKYLSQIVSFNVRYTDGSQKKLRMSAKKYLEELGFKTKVKVEVGFYTKEWGINKVNSKQKEFILYFNTHLMSKDPDYIKYVVAHEVAHIFVRDHSKQFDTVVRQLYLHQRKAERYLNAA